MVREIAMRRRGVAQSGENESVETLKNNARRPSSEGGLYPLGPLVLSLVAVNAVILAATCTQLVTRPWIPSFDNALIWLRTLDVGGSHPPLVGPYSRFGWDHPGPMLYYTLALPLHALNRSPTSILVGAFLIAVISTLGTVLSVWKRVGSAGSIVLTCGTAVLCFGLGDRLINPWNPFVLVLPFTLFLFASWMWAAGQSIALPVAAIAGSFAVQAHVGVSVAVVAILAAASLLRLIAPPPRTERSSAWSYVFTLLVICVLWAPPLWQQATASPGNLSLVAHFFLGVNPDPALGWKTALGIAAREFGPWGSWTGNEPVGLLRDIEPMPMGLLVLPATVMSATAAMAIRWRDALVVRLLVLNAVGVLASIYSYSQVRGVPYGYLLMWPRAVAMLCWIAPLVMIARKRSALRASTNRYNVWLAVTLTLVCGFVSARALTAALPDHHASRIFFGFVPEIVRAAPKNVLIRVVGSGVPFTVSPEAVAVSLIVAGRVPRLAPSQSQGAGQHRCVPGDAVLPTIALASGPAIDEFRDRGGRMIAVYEPLTTRQRAEAHRLRDTLEPQFREGKRDDLLPALKDAEHWLPLVAPQNVNRQQLGEYIKLASGDEQRAYAAFYFDNVVW